LLSLIQYAYADGADLRIFSKLAPINTHIGFSAVYLADLL